MGAKQLSSARRRDGATDQSRPHSCRSHRAVATVASIPHRDERKHPNRRNASEGVRKRPRNGDGRVCERRRGREPISRGDVEPDRIGPRCCRAREGTEDRQQRAERCDGFGEPLAGADRTCVEIYQTGMSNIRCATQTPAIAVTACTVTYSPTVGHGSLPRSAKASERPRKKSEIIGLKIPYSWTEVQSRREKDSERRPQWPTAPPKVQRSGAQTAPILRFLQPSRQPENPSRQRTGGGRGTGIQRSPCGVSRHHAHVSGPHPEHFKSSPQPIT